MNLGRREDETIGAGILKLSDEGVLDFAAYWDQCQKKKKKTKQKIRYVVRVID